MTSTIDNVASVVGRAGGTVVHKVRSIVGSSAGRPAAGGEPASGWLVVTVLCEPSEIDATNLPAPLAQLGDGIEVRVCAAAGGKGTELAVKQRNRASSGSAVSRLSGTDPQADLRSALRRAKQLIEVGEVLVVDPAPHGERPDTPGGVLLESFTKAAPKAGVR